ncbi:metallophosphoesterase [Sulfitobacter sp. S0837]|uniref:metallophosphoesterase n=1 Tax=Sulfitobacter maritimus TaxID=2741719 RepID=UPI0015825E16|nr:metallophosphoesterase [Sulfitobacter maritimus]NUH66506.1 metallophosphoesterase [Sulfitobacter maritimus]
MLGNWIKGLFAPKTPFPPIAPDAAFVALGDIHGRADLLARALDSMTDVQIVCVGDYVDRGDESAEALRMLQARPDVVCISGNHEEMMLNFLDHPQKHGPRWLRYGGLQTLASFDVAGASEGTSGAGLDALADKLKAAMGEELIQWLRSRPTLWRSGNVVVAHAGADPNVSIEEQTPETLHWGHAEFGKHPRQDGIWVLHGHTIVDTPIADQGRISIDTGAYATGRLTAAWVTDGQANFKTV